MDSHNASLLQQARRAAKAGRRDKARALLRQAARHNPQDHAAWLGLATLTASPETSLQYARRAALLRPDDPTVGKVVAWAERRQQQMALHATPTDETVDQPIRWRTVLLGGGAALLAVAILFLATVWFRSAAGETAVSSAAILPQGEENVASNQRQLPAVRETTVATPLPPSPTANPLQPKTIAQGKAGDPRPTWTVTPSPTPTVTPSPTPPPTFVSENNRTVGERPFGVGPDERWVDVNLTTQTLTAYEGNEPVMSTLISSGTWDHPTVTGQFRVWLRYESQTMDGRRLGYDYYLEDVPFVMYFFEDYALHGTYWHNNFGAPMSHGCVNMETADAAWLFNWTTVGTLVNVHH